MILFVYTFPHRCLQCNIKNSKSFKCITSTCHREVNRLTYTQNAYIKPGYWRRAIHTQDRSIHLLIQLNALNERIFSLLLLLCLSLNYLCCWRCCCKYSPSLPPLPFISFALSLSSIISLFEIRPVSNALRTHYIKHANHFFCFIIRLPWIVFVI